MSEFYDEMAATAAELLAEFGQPMTITRKGDHAYDPSTGTVTAGETTQTVDAVEIPYADGEIDGTFVQRGDKKLLAAAVGITAPGVGDTCTWSGVVYRIQNVKATSPAGTALVYELQLRK